MRPLEFTLLCLHAVIVVAIALSAPRRQTNDQFTIGARKVRSFGLSLSIFSTMVTESLIFFSVGLTARFGPIAGLAVIAGPCSGLIMLSLIAPRAHSYGKEHNMHCVSEYCLRQWGPVVGRFARFVLLALLFWIAILQINLNGNLISAILNWPLVPATSWAIVLVLFYILVGGYWTVIRTDIFQSFVLGTMVLIPFLISPRPSFRRVLDVPPPWKTVILIFAMSFSLTIVRPELWQRIYSAATGRKAAQSLRRACLLYFGLSGLVFYYAFAVVQAMPDVTSMQAFVQGYRYILPFPMSALFPVILLAAMMSSLDSAVFLFSVSLTKQTSFLAEHQTGWARVFVAVTLISAGFVSLTIFDSLAFAYKLDGIIALFALPLLISYWIPLPSKLLGLAVGAGLATYGTLIYTGRIASDPTEAFFGAAVTGVVLILSLVLQRINTKVSISMVKPSRE